MQRQQKRRITSSSLSMGGKTRAIAALEAGEDDESMGDVVRTPVKPMMQQKYNEADDNVVENPASTKTVKH